MKDEAVQKEVERLYRHYTEGKGYLRYIAWEKLQPSQKEVWIKVVTGMLVTKPASKRTFRTFMRSLFLGEVR